MHFTYMWNSKMLITNRVQFLVKGIEPWNEALSGFTLWSQWKVNELGEKEVGVEWVSGCFTTSSPDIPVCHCVKLLLYRGTTKVVAFQDIFQTLYQFSIVFFSMEIYYCMIFSFNRRLLSMQPMSITCKKESNSKLKVKYVISHWNKNS